MAPESGNDEDAELAGSQGARDRPKRIRQTASKLKTRRRTRIYRGVVSSLPRRLSSHRRAI